MWFISVQVEQDTSAHPPKKRSWIRPCIRTFCGHLFNNRAIGLTKAASTF